MKVHDLMSRNPIYCHPDATLSAVAALMAEHHCGEIPVCETNTHKPIGVITDRDITCRVVGQNRNPLELTAEDCMTTPCITTTPGTDLAVCCGLMEEHLIRRLPVIDNHGNLCGMIAQADIARHADGTTAAAVLRSVSQPHQHAARLAV